MSTILKVSKGLSVESFGFVAQRVAAFGLSVILARFLGPDQFGALSTISAVISFASIFTDLGIGVALARFLPQYLACEEFLAVKSTFWAVIGLSGLLGITFAFLCYISAPLIATHLFKGALDLTPALRVASIGILVNSFSTSMLAWLRGYQRWRYKFFSDLSGVVANILFTLLFLSLGLGIVGIQVANIGKSLIVLGIGGILILKALPFSKLKENLEIAQVLNAGRSLLKFSLPLAFSNVIYFINTWAGTIFLGAIQDPTDLSYYRVATTLANLIMFIPTAFKTVLMPAVSEISSDQDSEKIQQAFVISFKYLMYISLPMVVGIITLSSRIVITFYGNAYASAYLPLSYLVLVFAIRVISIPFYNLIVGSLGQSKILFGLNLIGAVVNIMGNYLLVPYYSYMGAITATFLSFLINIVFSVLYVRKLVPYKNVLGNLIKPLVASILMGTSLIFLNRTSYSNVWNLVLMIVIGAIIYIAVMFFIGAIGITEMDLFKEVLHPVLLWINKKNGHDYTK
jgi:O-antigen/teichoic acid export membrane protein